jgi:hypothetical protein
MHAVMEARTERMPRAVSMGTNLIHATIWRNEMLFTLIQIWQSIMKKANPREPAFFHQHDIQLTP